jgi:hypothetical protein
VDDKVDSLNTRRIDIENLVDYVRINNFFLVLLLCMRLILGYTCVQPTEGQEGSCMGLPPKMHMGPHHYRPIHKVLSRVHKAP